MSVFPNRNQNQTAIYWGTPTDDGYGGFTYADPVEITCRWVDSTRIIRNNSGREVACRAIVEVSQDLDEQGMLYLGELDDLDSNQEDDPRSVSGVYEIIRFDKIPTMNSGRFYRKAYL